MKGLLRRLSRSEGGFTLIELLIVVIILGILATIVVMNVSGAVGTAKSKSFVTALDTLQSASDRFYAQASEYPGVVSGGVCTQPTVGSNVYIDPTCADGNGNTFKPSYVRTAPDPLAADAGLNNATWNTSTMYWGVTDNGSVFATSLAPTGDSWASTDCVFTASSVNSANGALADKSPSCNGTVLLSTIE